MRNTAAEVSRRRIWRDIGLALLGAAVAAAPLVPASVPVWAEAAVAAAALLAAAACLIAHDRPAARGPRLPVALLSALAVLGVVQILPLPPALVRALAPGNWDVWREAADLLGDSAALSPRISIAPFATWGAAVGCAAAGAAILAAALATGSRGRRRFLAAAAYAGAAAALVAGGSAPLEDAAASASRDVELAAVSAIALGWLLTAVRVRRETAGQGHAERLERRILPIVAAALLLAAALGATLAIGSRPAALAAASGGILAGGALLFRRAGLGRAAALAGSALIALTLLAGTVAFRGTTFPVFEGPGSPGALALERRERLWAVSIDAVRSSPWVGWGLGAFPDAFRRAQPREVAGRVDAAPSELLQAAVTGGVVGALLALAAAVALVLSLARFWTRQRHREESALALAGLSFALALAVLGLFEATTAASSAPILSAAILGTAWSAAARGRRGGAADE